MDGEDRSFASAETFFLGQEDVFNDHTAFWRGIHTVVDGREGSLGAGAGMHGVKVMNQSFHGLESSAVGFSGGMLLGEGHCFFYQGGIQSSFD